MPPATSAWVPALIVIAIVLLGVAAWLWRRSTWSRERPPQQDKSTDRQARDTYRNLLDNVAHDVSNPLNNVLFILENMAKCSIEDEARWRQYQQLIGSEVRHLMKLTDRAKLLVKLKSLDAPITREQVNMKAAAEEVIMTYGEAAQARNVNLSYLGPQFPPWVLGDEAQLKQVLLNLVENGVKYCRDQGGAVVISMKTILDKLQVEVSDNGQGIPAENLDDIWNVAYQVRNARTLKIPGTGLGLAIVKQIVEQHGGEIRVWSRLGEGTAFTFTLPLYGSGVAHKESQDDKHTLINL